MRERAADLAQRLLVVRLGGVAPAFSPLNLPTSRARAVRSRPGSANVAFGVRHQAAARPRHVRGPDRLNWSSGLAGGGGYMPAPVTAGGGAAHGAARTPSAAVSGPCSAGPAAARPGRSCGGLRGVEDGPQPQPDPPADRRRDGVAESVDLLARTAPHDETAVVAVAGEVDVEAAATADLVGTHHPEAAVLKRHPGEGCAPLGEQQRGRVAGGERAERITERVRRGLVAETAVLLVPAREQHPLRDGGADHGAERVTERVGAILRLAYPAVVLDRARRRYGLDAGRQDAEAAAPCIADERLHRLAEAAARAVLAVRQDPRGHQAES